jgi:hypothetical protein
MAPMAVVKAGGEGDYRLTWEVHRKAGGSTHAQKPANSTGLAETVMAPDGKYMSRVSLAGPPC